MGGLGYFYAVGGALTVLGVFLALFIRGIGNADSIVLTKDPTVGVYYDGVYAARSTGLLADLLHCADSRLAA